MTTGEKLDEFYIFVALHTRGATVACIKPVKVGEYVMKCIRPLHIFVLKLYFYSIKFYITHEN